MSFRALEVSKNHAYVAPVTTTVLAGAVSDALFASPPPPGVVVVSTDGIAIKSANGTWRRILYAV